MNEETIATIRECVAQRSAAIRSRNRIDNATEALIRRALGVGYWGDIAASDRADFVRRAKALRLAVEKAKPIETPADAKVAEIVGAFIRASAMARAPYDALIKGQDARLSEFGESLPVWESFAKSVRGFGALLLAVIVGEAGDLSKYPNHRHLWKRFGLAPIQGKMASTWRRTGGLSAEEWTAAGYSPRRRSVAYLIADCLMKQNQDGYRALYDSRKALEAEQQPDMTKGQAHRRALVVVSKLLLKNLWVAWRRADGLPTATRRKYAARRVNS